MASVKYVENELAKEFSRLRKQLSGKGANKTAVSIQGDLMFVAADVDYSCTESYLVGFISSKMLEDEYHSYLIPQIRNEVDSFIQQYVPAACIRDMHFKTDIAAGYYFAIIIFTADIEKLIRQGKFVKPDPLTDGPDR